MLNRLVRLISHLPLWFHYMTVDFVLFPLIYHVVRYRRRLTRKNLTHSFPAYSWKQIKLLERQFYRHFCDVVVESIYGLTAPKEEITQRVKFHHLDLLEQAAHRHGGSIAILGHIGNWEWAADYSNQLKDPDTLSYNIYRQLKNQTFDQLLKDIRHRRGGEELEKRQAVRHIIAHRDKLPTIYAFLSDQKPSANDLNYWTTFMNQDTPFITGTEAIARKMKYPVLYVRIVKIKRGYYECFMEMIAEEPDMMTANQITEIYKQKLEANILADPSQWLWSHNRWKFSRQQS